MLFIMQTEKLFSQKDYSYFFFYYESCDSEKEGKGWLLAAY